MFTEQSNTIRINFRFEEAEKVAVRALDRLECRVADFGEESVQFRYPGTERVIEDSRLTNLKVSLKGREKRMFCNGTVQRSRLEFV